MENPARRDKSVPGRALSLDRQEVAAHRLGVVPKTDVPEGGKDRRRDRDRRVARCNPRFLLLTDDEIRKITELSSDTREFRVPNALNKRVFKHVLQVQQELGIFPPRETWVRRDRRDGRANGSRRKRALLAIEPVKRFMARPPNKSEVHSPSNRIVALGDVNHRHSRGLARHRALNRRGVEVPRDDAGGDGAPPEGTAHKESRPRADDREHPLPAYDGENRRGMTLADPRPRHCHFIVDHVHSTLPPTNPFRGGP